MKIPKSIRIGGVEYPILKKENVRMGTDICYGNITYGEQIELSESDGGGYEMQCITLLHEVLHGILWHYSGDKFKDEEKFVEVTAKGLYQVLQDNGGRLFDLASKEEE